MMKQTTLTSYFRAKSNTSIILTRDKMDSMNTPNRRRKLSLNRSQPNKTPKNNIQSNTSLKQEGDILVLSSDSEAEFVTPKKSFTDASQDLNRSGNPNCSVETIEYVLSPSMFPQKTPNAPSSQRVHNKSDHLSPPKGKILVRKDLMEQSNEENVCNLLNEEMTPMPQTPRTPSKTPQSKKSNDKYFSPTKKRLVTKRTPTKKNLTQLFNSETHSPVKQTDDFMKACEGLDDKTIFLLSIIDKYLKNDTLKQLLGIDSQTLLAKGMHAVKPGMKIMCRLYWRVAGWYRRDQLIQICSEDARTKLKKSNENRIIVDNPRMQEMIDYLVENRWMVCSTNEGENSLDFDEYVKLLKKAELVQICKEINRKAQSKQEAIQSLKNFRRVSSIAKFFQSNSVSRNNGAFVLEKLKLKAGQCYKLSDLARSTLDKLYVLMYLGADSTLLSNKKLELMLINEKINRETYPVDKNMAVNNASLVFQDENEYNRYFDAHKMYEDFLSEGVNRKIDIILDAYEQYKDMKSEEMLRSESLPPWLRRFTPCNIYVKILESGIQDLKKDKTEASYILALDILKRLIQQNTFRQHRKAEWYAEMALILHKHLDNSKKAAEVLLEGFNSNLSEELKDCMRARARLIANQQNIELTDELRDALNGCATRESLLEKNYAGIHVYKTPMDNFNQRGKQRFEVRTEDDWSVMSAEEYCIVHFINDGQYTHGGHWEGRIVTTMFFLLFWDIIYAAPGDAPGVFLSHYQRYPLDMFCDSFYENRKTLIDDRLLFIQESTDDMVLEIMLDKWEERPEYELSDIQRNIGWSNIKMVATCLGARGLAAICRRLAHNYGYAHSGFPDLTMWNILTKKITFVEVKTDGDQPSVKQLQWMEYLRSHEIDAAFCYLGVHTTRKRARPSHPLSQDQ